MVTDFVLLDNTYCTGILSADGHQWSTTAMTTDYMEKSFAGFPRSYPDGMENSDVDALAYSPAEFIWDNAIAHGKTLRDYGEFAITDKRWADPAKKGKIRFLDHWRDWTNSSPELLVSSRPGVESLRPYLCTNTGGWDMDIPDVFRAAHFIKELREYELQGTFPISFRTPYQSDSTLREQINRGQVRFVDMHLSLLPQIVRYGFLGPVHWAVVEACDMTLAGGIVLSTSVGASNTYRAWPRKS